jgi:hypothetical protein
MPTNAVEVDLDRGDATQRIELNHHNLNSSFLTIASDSKPTKCREQEQIQYRRGCALSETRTIATTWEIYTKDLINSQSRKRYR